MWDCSAQSAAPPSLESSMRRAGGTLLHRLSLYSPASGELGLINWRPRMLAFSAVSERDVKCASQQFQDRQQRLDADRAAKEAKRMSKPWFETPIEQPAPKTSPGRSLPLPVSKDRFAPATRSPQPITITDWRSGQALPPTPPANDEATREQLDLLYNKRDDGSGQDTAAPAFSGLSHSHSNATADGRRYSDNGGFHDAVDATDGVPQSSAPSPTAMPASSSKRTSAGPFGQGRHPTAAQLAPAGQACLPTPSRFISTGPVASVSDDASSDAHQQQVDSELPRFPWSRGPPSQPSPASLDAEPSLGGAPVVDAATVKKRTRRKKAVAADEPAMVPDYEAHLSALLSTATSDPSIASQTLQGSSTPMVQSASSASAAVAAVSPVPVLPDGSGADEVQRLTKPPEGVCIVNDGATSRRVVQRLIELNAKEYRPKPGKEPRFYACDTEVAFIDLSCQTPVGHGAVTCFSIYCGPDADFSPAALAAPLRDTFQTDIAAAAVQLGSAGTEAGQAAASTSSVADGSSSSSSDVTAASTSGRQTAIWVDIWDEVEKDEYGEPVWETNKDEARWRRQVKLKPYHPIIDAFKQFFEDKDVHKVWHNFSFDRHVLANMGIHHHGFGGDTLHMARLNDASRRGRKNYSLESLTADDEIMKKTKPAARGKGAAAAAGVPVRSRLEEMMGEPVERKVPMKKLFSEANRRSDGTAGKLMTMPSIQELQTNEKYRYDFIDYSARDAKATWQLRLALQLKLQNKHWWVENHLAGKLDLPLCTDAVPAVDSKKPAAADPTQPAAPASPQLPVLDAKASRTASAPRKGSPARGVSSSAQSAAVEQAPVAVATVAASGSEQQQRTFTLWEFYKLYWRPFGELLTDMEKEGMMVNREHLRSGEIQAELDKEAAIKTFMEWASKLVPGAKYMNTGSGAQIRQLLFPDYPGEVARGPKKVPEDGARPAPSPVQQRSLDLALQGLREFRAENEDYEDEISLWEMLSKAERKGLERPRRYREFELHGIWGPGERGRLVPDKLTPSGAAAVSMPALRLLSGKAGAACKLLAELREKTAADAADAAAKAAEAAKAAKAAEAVRAAKAAKAAASSSHQRRGAPANISSRSSHSSAKPTSEPGPASYGTEGRQFNFRSAFLTDAELSEAAALKAAEAQEALRRWEETSAQAAVDPILTDALDVLFEQQAMLDDSPEIPEQGAPHLGALDDEAQDPSGDEDGTTRPVLRENTAAEQAELEAYASKHKLGKLYVAMGGGVAGLEACVAIEALCEASAIAKLLDGFIKPLQSDNISSEVADGKYRIHCSLNINTETGRLSCRRPNLQNQPALEKDRYKVRKAFCADATPPPTDSLDNGVSPADADQPKPRCRNTFVVADYGQLELRLLAHMANCKSMLEAFELGGDFHSRTAFSMFDYIREDAANGGVIIEQDGKPENQGKEELKNKYAGERRKAKILNFSIAYGKTAFGLAKDWGTSLEEAEDTVRKWYAARQEVQAWQEATRADAKASKQPFVRTLLGRTRPLPDITSDDRSKAGHASRAAINTPIQGSAADIATAAMVCIKNEPWFEANGWKLIMQIHDEVILEGPEDTADEAQALVKKCMSNPWRLGWWHPDDEHRSVKLKTLDDPEPLLVDLVVDADHEFTWYDAK